ncbi:hypothetical protein Tco_1256768 [Tanacetum coccineum]
MFSLVKVVVVVVNWVVEVVSAYVLCGKGERVLNWTSSGVIGKRVRVMSIDVFLELEVVEEFLEEEMLSMEDEVVPLVDGVFEGALGALGDDS